MRSMMDTSNADRHGTQSATPTLVLISQNISQRRANEPDFVFLQDIIVDPECPDSIGYNARLCHKAGMILLPKTDVSFLPLIDRPPTDPDPIKTAIEQGLSIIKGSSEDILIST